MLVRAGWGLCRQRTSPCCLGNRQARALASSSSSAARGGVGRRLRGHVLGALGRARSAAAARARSAARDAGARARERAARPFVRMREAWARRLARAGAAAEAGARWVAGAGRWLAGGIVLGLGAQAALRTFVIVPFLTDEADTDR